MYGVDGHYWSFSTHGLIAISRASRPGTLKGYWDVVGSVLVNESVIVNSGRTGTSTTRQLSQHTQDLNTSSIYRSMGPRRLLRQRTVPLLLRRLAVW